MGDASVGDSLERALRDIERDANEFVVPGTHLSLFHNVHVVASYTRSLNSRNQPAPQMAAHMPDNGFQIVMFTHQDVRVWADLAEILWAAGLQVTAGWCIATETESATRVGNYVQGTVLLVLRKRLGNEAGFIARLQRPVENAVRAQLHAI